MQLELIQEFHDQDCEVTVRRSILVTNPGPLLGRMYSHILIYIHSVQFSSVPPVMYMFSICNLNGDNIFPGDRKRRQQIIGDAYEPVAESV